MKTRHVFQYFLIAFASIETILFVLVASSQAAAPANGIGHSANPLLTYSPTLSLAGWTAVGLVALQGQFSNSLGRRSQAKKAFAKLGFGGEVYDLMIGMRGGGSRLLLLRNLDSPRHRSELAELTRIDWREVDRQLSVLEKYGLVKLSIETGTVKLYQVTQQGKLLLNLIQELNGGKSS
jgi:DNA-binding transcriptional ArsR family regulator